MRHVHVLAVGALACVAGGAAAAPSLVGDTIERVQYAQSTGNIVQTSYAVVADPGVEYIDSFDFTGEFRRFNIGATSIRMDTRAAWYSPWFDSGNLPSYVEFRDLDFGEPGWAIGGVNVTWGGAILVDDSAPLNYPAFSSSVVAFNADTVRLYTGPYRFDEGSWVQIDFIMVPAPSAAAIGGLGLLLATRRRR